MRFVTFCTTLVVLGIAAGLLQLWFAPWSPAFFAKLEITLGAVLTAALVIWYGQREYSDYTRQRDGDHLDR